MWLELKYIHLLAPNLTNFVDKGNNVFNFRCPMCGDSTKNRSKARGYLLLSRGKFGYYCHNCHVSCPLAKLIKHVSLPLFENYVTEAYLDKKPKKASEDERKPSEICGERSVLFHAQSLVSVSQQHDAYTFLERRKIPKRFFRLLRVSENFNELAFSITSDKRYNPAIAETRIVIPMLNQHKKLIGFQGRAIDQNPLRYITVMLSPANPKIFGLDTVDFNKTNYIFEGPFDSMFIGNSIATCGGLIHKEIQKHGLPVDRSVIVYDNEPRNPDIVKNMRRAAKAGWKVCVWPHKTAAFGTDVNDIVCNRVDAGSTVKQACTFVQKTIDDNTHQGDLALLEISQWRRDA